MPAKITKSSALPETFANPIELRRFGAKASGMLFVDGEGQTFIGTEHPRSAMGAKLVLVTSRGSLVRMVEAIVKWPLRLAPSDHVVTFSNEA